jgi:hypothetical protein
VRAMDASDVSSFKHYFVAHALTKRTLIVIATIQILTCVRYFFTYTNIISIATVVVIVIAVIAVIADFSFDVIVTFLSTHLIFDFTASVAFQTICVTVNFLTISFASIVITLNKSIMSGNIQISITVTSRFMVWIISLYNTITAVAVAVAIVLNL